MGLGLTHLPTARGPVDSLREPPLLLVLREELARPLPAFFSHTRASRPIPH